MGSAASKPARSAAGAATRRQYPKKPAPPPRAPAAPPKKTQESKPTPTPAPTPPSARASTPAQGPTYHSKEQPSATKSNAIDLDGRDPDFAASLRTIGPVDPSGNFSHPNPFNRGTVQTVFPTSSNPALLVVTARQRITKAAQEESLAVGNANFSGRQFLDSFTISQALMMRDQQGLPSKEIERTLRLKSGTIDKLGKSGIVSRAA
ncbi:uncharacterized protein N7484_011523 [Penicillium longicatenatum]|uniref:uncharacterized protein n=1 Tax=Penicillium longicatenatum TaxID=1561947 RepID=UPI0025491EED|nr:uncharacterized protein N7484_011523 [Penicillium longicatenatum]KAJ5631423.1 hypothetical protein N7484_011523 [Penicillium longicatenatum]